MCTRLPHVYLLTESMQKANVHTETLRMTTVSAHDSTSRIVQEQKQHVDVQLQALDGIVSKIKETNDTHHESHLASLRNLSSTAEESYTSIGTHLKSAFGSVKDLDGDIAVCIKALQESSSQISPTGPVVEKLHDLASQIGDRQVEEYEPTGNTPKRTTYEYTTSLPETQSHDTLIAKARNPTSDMEGPGARSPNKAKVFADADSSAVPASPTASRPATSASTASSGLKELDINVVGMPTNSEMTAGGALDVLGKPALKRQNTNTIGLQEKLSADSRLPMKRSTRMTVVGTGQTADRENLPLPNLSASVGPGGIGRRLRSQNSS